MTENKPTIKTHKDKGIAVDYFNYGDGKEVLFYRIEEFRGLQIGAVKIGWTNKYAVVSPQALTEHTLDLMATSGSIVTGSSIKPEDFVAIVVSGTVGIGVHGTAEVKEVGTIKKNE
jgi:hypothetical protein